MIKKISSVLLLALSIGASAATLNPIQLLNPSGSTAGQAIISTGATTAPAWGNATASGLVAQAANTVVANATGSSASPTAFPMPSCSGANQALRWTAGSGFACASSIALTTGTLTQFAATTSAQLAGIVSDETGSGLLVFGTNPTLSGATISGGTINSTPIGATTASTGAFTTLSASSTVSGTGFSTYLASPPAIGGTAPAAGSFTTLGATGLISPSSTAGIKGTATNDNANAGSVGEFPTPTNLTGVALTSGTPANVSSVSLTAGDWEISGCVYYSLASTTTVTSIAAGINTTSATMPATPGPDIAFLNASFVAGPNSDIECSPIVRKSLSSTTTVFLIGQATFATSTLTANGYLHIRRIR